MCDRKDRFVKRGVFRYDFRSTQPNFDQQDPGKGKCGCVGGFWIVSRL